ncbi:hypothetical protein RaK2_00417 [Klebsiella phage vB_KleM_RaK2]|uniref:Uncharacterized protein n=1 Tax=Klebsiella phage vB_KleM_RaK2 TaxID=1147094 RepID=H6X4M4_9CAUD|nr:hypothetical protein F403_gp118 [Klebsiella phage vB_KleM_RaK2]AFA44690.1 hypothetical protein RaK2_00417 [Klebsiella phage vB_KleM_RaK2]
MNMKNSYIYDEKENKDELIQHMTIQECFEYADKVIDLYNILHNKPKIKILNLAELESDKSRKHKSFEYTSNDDLVYSEDNHYFVGTSFIEIYTGIRYIPESVHKILGITSGTTSKLIDIGDVIIENTEEDIFQYSTVYSDHELKHLIILSAIKKNRCREFFMDLNYLEFLLDYHSILN